MRRRALVAALLVAAGCDHHGARGACRVLDDVGLTAPRDAVPVALATGAEGDALALVVVPEDDTLRTTHATLFRVARGAVDTVRALTLDAPGYVAGFAATPSGPAFAVATPRAVVGYVLDARGALRSVSFPRGEAPPGRDAIAPVLALADDPGGGLAALADFTDAFGAHRIHTRDVGESAPYTPRRRDVFAGPSLLVASGALQLVAQRTPGTFTAPATHAASLELEALPADAFGVPRPRPVHLVDVGPEPAEAHAASLEPDARALVVVYGAASRVAAVGVRLDAPIAPGAPVVLSDARIEPGSWRVTTLPAQHEALFAWIERGATGDARVVVRSAGVQDNAVALHAARAEFSLGATSAPVRLEIAHAGERVVVAVERAGGVTALEVRGATLAPIALPSGLARGRLAGLAGDGSRVVLAVATAYDDAGAHVAFATLPADGGARAEPAPETIASDVRAIALLDTAMVLAGRAAAGGIRLDRIESDPAEVTAFGSRGDAFVLAASVARDRVWVAEPRAFSDELFGPAQSIVVQSFVAGIEDGPRTDVRASVVPWAAFDRVTLDAIALASPARRAWAASFSAGRASGGACLAGAWIVLHDARDDAPIVPAAGGAAFWPGALALVEPARASCDDRVDALRWDGPRFAALVTTRADGTRLIVGDAAAGTVAARTAIAPRVGASTSGLARFDGGWVVATPANDGLWLARFDAAGRARVTAARVAVASGPSRVRPDAPAMAADGAGLRVGYAGANGPRVVRVACDR